MSRVVALLSSALTVAVATTATAALAKKHGFDLDDLHDLHRSIRGGPTPVTVYLHRDGGRVMAGEDDPQQARSGVLARSGVSVVDVPAFRGTDRQWSQLVGCVENHFRDFDVTVVDERPAGNDYVGVMVGGSPKLLGLAPTVGGVAPYTGKVLPSSVVFVFQTPHRTTRALCDTTAHEIGHTMGLDHSRKCDDVMSYEACGSKAFRNTHAHCGEWSDRPCADGRSAQNSWSTLAALVGTRRSSAPPPAPKSTTVRRPPAPTKPSLRVKVGPAEANSTYVVKVDARDPAGIKDVELVWYDRRARKLTCGKPNPARPFTCARRGSEYVFSIPVGTGNYKFVARYTNGQGQLRRTVAYQASFR
ncbi:MAG: matrixin family metalloprotease [Nannocystaceae bacterium]|nr:matrixin family metalloprotease [bacterium]